MALLGVVVLVALVAATVAKPPFMKMIPNGIAVPYPCKPGHVWHTVGHLNTHPTVGHPVLNPFGQDFLAAGNKWTHALCRKDSDGDGKTNGEELGDPHCHWKVGATPEQAASGHPGFDDSDCQSSL